MSLLLSTQITAVATAVLAAFAIATTFVAGMAFRKQSKEVVLLGIQLDEQRQLGDRQATVLELQARELAESLKERQVNREQQHRAQATRIFIWEDRQVSGNVTAHVKNASVLPIYDVEVAWYNAFTVLGKDTFERPMMPNDDSYSTPLLVQTSEAHTEDVAAVHSDLWFRDAAGTSWRARPDGIVEEVPPGKEPPRAI
jgi:hypothetical protein